MGKKSEHKKIRVHGQHKAVITGLSPIERAHDPCLKEKNFSYLENLPLVMRKSE